MSERIGAYGSEAIRFARTESDGHREGHQNETEDPRQELFAAWDRLSDDEREVILPTLIHDTALGTYLGPLVPWRPQRPRHNQQNDGLLDSTT